VNRIAFLGTPAAAVPSLTALAESYPVGVVVTRPDRPRGRSGKPMPSPVKEHADAIGLPVIQAESSSALREGLEAHGPFEVGVVVAYGRILLPEVLNLPTHGILNVHFSLLPRWRGAAPVARALISGDKMTGVTIIQLDEGLDTGPVITAQAMDIASGEDAGSLTSRLAEVGARLLLDSLPAALSGSLQPITQSNDGLTYAEKITSEDRVLDVGENPESFVNKVRGLSPTPGATLQIDGQPHKILEASVTEHTSAVGSWALLEGMVVAGVGGGSVEIVRLQPPGRRPQSGADWVRGRRKESGQIL